MITYAEAMALIAALPLRSTVERLPLAAARGRILTEDLVLPRDQPSFDRATMDGYAVAVPVDGSAIPAAFTVVGEVHAGSVWPGTLRPGEAVAINTGAPCPPGTTVVPFELVRPEPCSDPARIQLLWDALERLPGRNIAWTGEDGRQGAVVARAGTQLTPVVAALAGMCGRSEVAVAVPPRLSAITTGDEVLATGAAGIGDSNGPFLDGFAHALGVPLVRQQVGDQPKRLEEAIRAAHAASDIVITTGGVSTSASDLVPAAAQACGFATVFHRVDIQPGKPVLLARHADGGLLVGLPGNAVSVVATAHLFLLPVLGRLLGGWTWSWLSLPMAQARPAAKRHQFLPARLLEQGVAVVPWNGSGDLLAAATADALVELPAGQALATGHPVRVLPYVGGSSGGRGLLPPRGSR